MLPADWHSDIPALSRQKQEEPKLKASLGYETPSQQTKVSTGLLTARTLATQKEGVGRTLQLGGRSDLHGVF